MERKIKSIFERKNLAYVTPHGAHGFSKNGFSFGSVVWRAIIADIYIKENSNYEFCWIQ